jgi:hypothetical protein
MGGHHVSENTHKNDARAWNCYLKYCDKVRLRDNIFLDGISQQERIKITGALAVAVRQGQLLAATFRENGCGDPKKDTTKTLADFYDGN